MSKQVNPTPTRVSIENYTTKTLDVNTSQLTPTKRLSAPVQLEEVIGEDLPKGQHRYIVRYSDGSVTEELREYGFDFSDGTFRPCPGLVKHVNKIMDGSVTILQARSVITTLTKLLDTKSYKEE